MTKEEEREYKHQWYLAHKEEAKARSKKYFAEHKEEQLAKQKIRYEENKETYLAKQKLYRDTHKEEIRERDRIYKENGGAKRSREKHKEKRNAHFREYYKEHKQYLNEYHREYMKGYRKTKEGLAMIRISNYRREDLKHERGECTLEQGWFIDNILNKSCVYCGDSNFEHLGADRIDNEKPHTPDNCVCACGICNVERHSKGMTVEGFKTYRLHNPRFIDLQERKRKAFIPGKK